MNKSALWINFMLENRSYCLQRSIIIDKFYNVRLENGSDQLIVYRGIDR